MKGVAKFGMFFAVMVFFATLASCSSTKKMQEIHDTVYLSKVVTDIQYKHDSVYVDRWHSKVMEGDTVYLVDSVYVYRYRLLHDTLSLTDTVYKVSENIKQEEITKYKTPSWAWWCLGMVILMVAGGVLYIYIKVKK